MNRDDINNNKYFYLKKIEDWGKQVTSDILITGIFTPWLLRAPGIIMCKQEQKIYI